MTEPAQGRHADPCTCYNDLEYGFIVGSKCSQFMGATAHKALNKQEPQTADPATSATPGSGTHDAGESLVSPKSLPAEVGFTLGAPGPTENER